LSLFGVENMDKAWVYLVLIWFLWPQRAWIMFIQYLLS